MSATELRVDPLSGTAVLLAPGRRGVGAARPAGLPTPSGRCPFCPGHEDDTEIVEHEERDASGAWVARVVRNRFPVAAAPAMPDARHEVIVESRDHDADLTTMSASEIETALRATRARLRALEAAPRIESVIYFRNRGRRAGSSQPHPHAQLVALPIVLPGTRARAELAAEGASGGRTLLDRVLDDERAEGSRIVADEDGWVTLCPYASERAFAARIAPGFRAPRFSALGDDALATLAARLGDLCARLAIVTSGADYNVLIRDLPITSDAAHTFFVVDVLPRTGGDAGLELATGASVCVVRPEDAAAALRALSARA